MLAKMVECAACCYKSLELEGVVEGLGLVAAGKCPRRHQSRTCWTASSAAATPTRTPFRTPATSTPLPPWRYCWSQCCFPCCSLPSSSCKGHCRAECGMFVCPLSVGHPTKFFTKLHWCRVMSRQRARRSLLRLLISTTRLRSGSGLAARRCASMEKRLLTRRPSCLQVRRLHYFPVMARTMRS